MFFPSFPSCCWCSPLRDLAEEVLKIADGASLIILANPPPLSYATSRGTSVDNGLPPVSLVLDFFFRVGTSGPHDKRPIFFFPYPREKHCSAWLFFFLGFVACPPLVFEQKSPREIRVTPPPPLLSRFTSFPIPFPYFLNFKFFPLR